MPKENQKLGWTLLFDIPSMTLYFLVDALCTAWAVCNFCDDVTPAPTILG